MTTVVITPPAPIVTPSDIPGSHAANDPRITAYIQAATEEIDGPNGWVGRAFGPQTLEKRVWAFDPCGMRLDCPPIIEIVSVKYDAGDGTEQEVDADDYALVTGGNIVRAAWGKAWPSIRTGGMASIRYRAGYDGTTTGDVPERARQAVILAVGELMSVGGSNSLFLQEVEVEGVGRRRYVVSEAAGKVIQQTTNRLLNGLWVPRV